MVASRVIVAFALLVLPGCNREPYSRSSSGVSALEKKLLYDFRHAASSLPRLDRATERRVLTAVSPEYYDNLLECPSGKYYGEGVVLRIAAAVTGSFTAPGAKETAYLVDVAKCGQTMAELTSGDNRLVVFSGNHVVASVATRDDDILKAYDLNRDGTDELLLAGGSANSGEVTTTAALVRFDKKALVTIENYGTVYHDVCGLLFPPTEERRRDLTSKGVEPVAEAVAISYLPAPGRQMPGFVAERYRAPCPLSDQPLQWVRVGE